ncbi:hypothetical protein [Pararhizobium gei]|uniref:hypothetical protein n=1 Tax=Pararhizobium gei TaxID=1395951 RepID=UPI0023DB4B5F|nr:hypothetical protein [Rhizobium gei]
MARFAGFPVIGHGGNALLLVKLCPIVVNDRRIPSTLSRPLYVENPQVFKVNRTIRSSYNAFPLCIRAGSKAQASGP